MTTDSNLTQHLAELTELAKQAGAQGIWLIRAAHTPRLLYYTDTPKAGDYCPSCGSDEVNDVIDYHNDQIAPITCGACDFVWEIAPITLQIADPAGIILLVRFPTGDGGEPGIEVW